MARVRFQPDLNLILKDYSIGKTLGEGSFAKVKMATHLPTRRMVALKILDKVACTDQYVLKNMHREALIAKRLNHPNIAKIYEVIETPELYVLSMELCSGGEMLDYIITRDRLHEREARKFVRQIASALNHMHSKGVTHRDMKPENLLLDRNLDVKLIDFGLSNMFEGEEFLSTRCGSFEYSAPELIGAKPYLGPEVDYYTMGVNLYAMLTGELPFQSDNISVVYKLQCREEFPIPFYLTNDCQNLIRRLLKAEPRQRITPAELAVHPWIVAGGGPLEDLKEDDSLTVIDEDVMACMNAIGFTDRNAIIESVLNRTLDNLFSAYRLLYFDVQKAREDHHRLMEDNMDIDNEKEKPFWAAVVPFVDFSSILAANPAPERTMKHAATVMVDRSDFSKGGFGLGRRMDEDDDDEAPPLFGQTMLLGDGGDGLGGGLSSGLLSGGMLGGGLSNLPDDDEEEPQNKGLLALAMEQQPAAAAAEAAEAATPPSPAINKSKRGLASFLDKVPRFAKALGAGVGAASGSGAMKRANTIEVDISSREDRRRFVPPTTIATEEAILEDSAMDVDVVESKNGPKEKKNRIASFLGTNKPKKESERLYSKRFAFSCQTISQEPPLAIRAAVLKALADLGISHHLSPENEFLISCVDKQMKFEIEICEIPGLRNMHGVRFNRISGDLWYYKERSRLIVGSLKLL